MQVSDPSTDEARRLASERPPAWKPLRFFNIYRAVLAALFVLLVLWGVAPRPIGEFDYGLFRLTAYAYFGFSIASLLASYFRWFAYDAQVGVQVFVDIVAITIFMHASGGVQSGFGMLLIVTIAGGSILTQGRIAILFAAMASLAVLTQQIYVWLVSPFPVTNYPHAGILGATFFITAYLAYVSARRIKASEALAAKRGVDIANLAQLNEHIVRRMQSGILAIDDRGRIRLVNTSACRLLGLPEGIEDERLRLLAPGLHELMRRWMDDPTRSSYLYEPDAAQLKVVASFAAIGPGAADGVLVFLEDASAMTQRAQQLKLASLGRLAASIAHEIRNPLGAVSHAGQLLGESPHLDDPDRRLLHIIRENSARMNAIVENVLQLSRGRQAEPESVEIAPWLRAFAEEFAASSGVDRETLVVDVEPPDLRVRVDPSQLRQVVWNLCENGVRHANGSPRLELVAGISDDTRRPYLEIGDNGDGIPAELSEQIFEPFFTTRSDGTGLGLYLSRELCEGNQAALSHVPAEHGARFRITFSDPRRQGAITA